MGCGDSKELPDWVVKEGDMTHANAGKKFCLLTQELMLFFSSRKAAYSDFDHPDISLPLYDIVVSDATYNDKTSNMVFLRTIERQIPLKPSKDALGWITAIRGITKSKEILEERRAKFDAENRWTLHVNVMEAKFPSEDMTNTESFAMIYVDKDDTSATKNHGSFTSYDKEKVKIRTEAVSGKHVVWNEPMSLAAVDPADTVVICAMKGSGKLMGSVRVPLRSMDLGADPEEYFKQFDDELLEKMNEMDFQGPELEDEDEEMDAAAPAEDQDDASEDSVDGMEDSDEEPPEPPPEEDPDDEFGSDSSDDEDLNRTLTSSKMGSTMGSTTGASSAQQRMFLRDSSGDNRMVSRFGGIDDDDDPDMSRPENFDYENRPYGMHRWLDLKGPKGRTIGSIHICIRAVPASTLRDFTMESTDFHQERSELLSPKYKYLDDQRYTTPLKIYVGTWNVGNARPQDDLESWIPKTHEYDIMAFGAQECKYEPRKGFKSCRADWTNHLAKNIGNNYQLLEFQMLMEIRLAVFVRKSLLPEISHIHKAKEATGIAGVIGNKGGTVVNFFVKQTSICFMNAHLAAHQDMLEKRNLDLYNIVTSAKNGCKADITTSFHMCFVMGDLNYRLDYGDQGKNREPSEQQYHEMVDLVRKKRFKHLFQYDQLREQLDAMNVLSGFKEGEYDFEPTFKVKRKTKLEYNVKRSPAYCDRILWRVLDGHHVEQVEFNNALDVLSSDHKPVYSVFETAAHNFTHATDLTYDGCLLSFTDFDLKRFGVKSSSSVVYSFKSDAFIGGRIEVHSDDFEANKGFSVPVSLLYTNIDRIKQYFLIVEALNPDSSLIGYGMIPFAKIFFTPRVDVPCAYPFRTHLSKGGKAEAKLSGSVVFTWTKTNRKVRDTQKYTV